jgi:hypothetical protein
MSCTEITNLDDALKRIPSSVLPIDGLRRDSNGNLTKDAMRMIIDGIKSRGIDPTNTDINAKLRSELSIFLCSLNNQYQFLIKVLLQKFSSDDTITKEFIDIIKDKNITMQDVLNTSGYLSMIDTKRPDSDFIEGWQNTVPKKLEYHNQTIEGLQSDMSALGSKSYLELKKEMVEVSAQKNRVAANSLGLYGFLNIVAVGLLIYIGASK